MFKELGLYSMEKRHERYAMIHIRIIMEGLAPNFESKALVLRSNSQYQRPHLLHQGYELNIIIASDSRDHNCLMSYHEVSRIFMA